MALDPVAMESEEREGRIFIFKDRTCEDTNIFKPTIQANIDNMQVTDLIKGKVQHFGKYAYWLS